MFKLSLSLCAGTRGPKCEQTRSVSVCAPKATTAGQPANIYAQGEWLAGADCLRNARIAMPPRCAHCWPAYGQRALLPAVPG